MESKLLEGISIVSQLIDSNVTMITLALFLLTGAVVIGTIYTCETSAKGDVRQ